MRYACLSRVRPSKRIYRRRQNIIFGAPTSLLRWRASRGCSSVLDSILLRRKPWGALDSWESGRTGSRIGKRSLRLSRYRDRDLSRRRRMVQEGSGTTSRKDVISLSSPLLLTLSFLPSSRSCARVVLEFKPAGYLCSDPGNRNVRARWVGEIIWTPADARGRPRHARYMV